MLKYVLILGGFMDSVSYQKLEIIQEEINNQFGFSYNTLNNLKENGYLDKILELYDIPYCLKNELISFFNMLDNPDLNNFPYLRKILLHESDFVKIFRDFGYIISLYLNNQNCYRVFPLFLKEMIDKFEIDYYKDLPIEDILNKRMDLKYSYNRNEERNLVEISPKSRNIYTDYSKYEEKIRMNTLNIYDLTEFFIWAENYSYILEYNELKKYPEYNTDCIVRWISKYHGDGYGFDILSYDPILKKQKLIEVKSGKSDLIELSRNELKILYEAVENNCDYYIYRYYFNVKTQNLEFYKLKYDAVQEKFIDINNPNNVFYISPYFYFEDDKQKIGIAIETEKEFYKSLMI